MSEDVVDVVSKKQDGRLYLNPGQSKKLWLSLSPDLGIDKDEVWTGEFGFDIVGGGGEKLKAMSVVCLGQKKKTKKEKEKKSVLKKLRQQFLEGAEDVKPTGADDAKEKEVGLTMQFFETVKQLDEGMIAIDESGVGKLEPFTFDGDNSTMDLACQSNDWAPHFSRSNHRR